MLTPEQIDAKEFTRGVRGYKDTEVDVFLDEVIKDYKSILDENKQLKGRLNETEIKLMRAQSNFEQKTKEYDDLHQEYLNLENSLYTTLESAKTLMTELKDSSEKRAETLIEDAKLEAAHILRSTRASVEKLRQQEEMLRNRVISSRTRFEYLLEAELKTIKGIDVDILGVEVQDEFDAFLASLEEKLDTYEEEGKE